ncbi:hypothetical protein [Jatrophihabitans sp.]|nr:hypothetical protein [Jatrophihabitans sp.]
MSRPAIRDRNAAIAGGVLCILLGSWLLYDAYEARGISKPYLAKFLPGV